MRGANPRSHNLKNAKSRMAQPCGFAGLQITIKFEFYWQNKPSNDGLFGARILKCFKKCTKMANFQ